MIKSHWKTFLVRSQEVSEPDFAKHTHDPHLPNAMMKTGIRFTQQCEHWRIFIFVKLSVRSVRDRRNCNLYWRVVLRPGSHVSISISIMSTQREIQVITRIELFKRNTSQEVVSWTNKHHYIIFGSVSFVLERFITNLYAS